MVWVLITVVGLVAEVSGIIALGQHMTGRDDVAVNQPVVAATVPPRLLTGELPRQRGPALPDLGAVREPNIVADMAIRRPAASGRVRQEEPT